MEIEASVLLEAEEQAHLITVPCVLKCELPIWSDIKVQWKGPGWYTKEGPEVVPFVAVGDGGEFKPCRKCSGLPDAPQALPPEKPPVEEETQKRSERIDMVYLEGNDDDGHPTSLALLPEELAHLQGGETYSSCPHLTVFYDREGCSIHGCGAM